VFLHYIYLLSQSIQSPIHLSFLIFVTKAACFPKPHCATFGVDDIRRHSTYSRSPYKSSIHLQLGNLNKKSENCKRATAMLTQTYKGGSTNQPTPDVPASAPNFTPFNNGKFGAQGRSARSGRGGLHGVSCSAQNTMAHPLSKISC